MRGSLYVNEYAELKQLVKQRGLLDGQPLYYTYKILLTLGLLALALGFLVAVDNFWLRLLDAAFLAFVFTQIGFLNHDLGHREVFPATRKNTIGGLLLGNVLLGLSYTWWVDTHNRHHSKPNQLGLDPDIDIPVLAFIEEQAASKRGLARLIVRYQAYLIFPLMCLQAIMLHFYSFQFLLQKKTRAVVPDILLMVLHFALYCGLLLYLLGPWQTILFILVHQALFGLYMVSVFAPNHIGMPILDRDSRLDFLHRQVLTARNVKPSPLTDFWTGGLNYQIEHHLFPGMARNKLKEAQQIVKAFCQAHSIPYRECSMLQSYRDLLQDLHRVSAPLREGSRRFRPEGIPRGADRPRQSGP